MKRTMIIAVILVGMIGWTLYESLGSNDGVLQDQLDENIESETGEGTPEKVESDIPEEDIGITQGMYAPDFELATLDGETAKLSDYRGQKIMLNFWATWCPPCRAEMPDMQRVYEEHDDAMILAVNLTETETGVAQVESFAEDFGLTFPILLDEHVEVAGTFGIQPVPTSFMINTKGRIDSIAIGPMNEDMIIQRFNEMD
ncbi:redoxin domain-containing protein [Bacillus alkalicola]|uniref:Redoxin domain-containing protein n=2 Tax=Bacillaceae TaxID=186817 RepID=A0ABS6JVI6_9BACI|nr:redoxin domain-containing protein [Bacillus alkalicola]MBU9722604.1 redoxin domain-containing protein [Bacillus alkalicola]